MFLGKRARRSIKRTTSTSKLAVNLEETAEGVQQADGDQQQKRLLQMPVVGMVASSYSSQSAAVLPQRCDHQQFQYPSDGLDAAAGYPLSMPPPPSRRNPRRYSADYAMESAQHLRVCSLCKRRLGPGRETFMYRGEVAFCSLECRQQRIMMEDERKAKFSQTNALMSLSEGTDGN